MLQWLIQLEIFPTLVQAVEKRRIPPPPHLGKIEYSHKFPVRKKRKNLIQEEEDNLIENDIQIFSLDDMELGADIEKIFPMMEQPEIVTHQKKLLEVVANDIFSEKESFTFQSVIFYKESKKLIVE
jgi:hypothetical protein